MDFLTQSATIPAPQGAIIDFAPARVILRGETATERRVNLIRSGSATTALYFANAKGKMGGAARETISGMGARRMVKEVRTGNYRSAAECLAGLLGHSVVITSRASWESIPDRLESELADLKGGGYKEKDGIMTATPKRVAIESAIALVAGIREGVEALIQSEATERAARAIEEARQSATECAAA